MLHVCSALTHLADGVRSDALATLELMLDHAPRGALGRYTAQVLGKLTRHSYAQPPLFITQKGRGYSITVVDVSF